jgi:hypothetical protein
MVPPPLDRRAQLDLLSRGQQGDPADRIEPPGLAGHGEEMLKIAAS